MKYTSSKSCREIIRENLQSCRQLTLDLCHGVDQQGFSQQAHPDFSPVGWHLGHIAFTEAYWILEYCASLTPIFPEYHQLFAADGLPKSQRQNLPSLEAILDYLHTVRTKVLDYLEIAPTDKQERLWRWLIQHESQHSETISFVLELHRRQKQEVDPNVLTSSQLLETPMVEIPAGEFEIGSNTVDAQDNERPQHRLYLDTYWIDTYPITCGQYRQFIQSGGYQKSEFWSETGWQWLAENPLNHPLYWSNSSDWDNHPVCGVSYYEAEAYANFMGKRLPTEVEWEKAASWDPEKQEKRLYPWFGEELSAKYCNHNTLVGQTTPVNAYPAGKSASGCCDMLGNVWEWTASWFAGYQSFNSYPYHGYSQTYFDQQHRVLKGGSWATRPWGLRCSFRNWYHPWVRQIFAGFRLVNNG